MLNSRKENSQQSEREVKVLHIELRGTINSVTFATQSTTDSAGIE